MASTASSTMPILLALNLLFFTLVTATHHRVPCPPPPPKVICPPPPPKAPKPSPSTPPSTGSCPRDALKLGVCANLLKDLLHAVVGTPPKKPCCPLLEGLVDLEAAVCLCTAIKANLLGINLDVPVSLSLLLNYCGKSVPKGFQCA